MFQVLKISDMVRIMKIVRDDDNVELVPYFFTKQQFENFEPVEKYTSPDENYLELSGNGIFLLPQMANSFLIETKKNTEQNDQPKDDNEAAFTKERDGEEQNVKTENFCESDGMDIKSHGMDIKKLKCSKTYIKQLLKRKGVLSTYDSDYLKCFFKVIKKLVKSGKAKNCKIKRSKSKQAIVFVDNKRIGNLKGCLPILKNILKTNE